jgi:2-keto-4-pentenoate hydratase
LVDTIADNASSGLFVLGPEGRPLGDADLGTWKMTMRKNGTVVSVGSGRDNAHGDPIKGLMWLAREAYRRGRPLLRDEIVLAGSLGPMVPIEEGDYFSATIENMPEASVHFLPSSVARSGSKTPLVR